MVYVHRLKKDNGELEFNILADKKGNPITIDVAKKSSPWLLLYLWLKYPKLNQISFLDCYVLRSDPNAKQLINELQMALNATGRTVDSLKKGDIKFVSSKVFFNN